MRWKGGSGKELSQGAQNVGKASETTDEVLRAELGAKGQLRILDEGDLAIILKNRNITFVVLCGLKGGMKCLNARKRIC